MRRWLIGTTIMVAALGTAVTGCTAGGGAVAPSPARPAAPAVRLAISPADTSRDVATDAPIVVTAAGGKVSDVSVRTSGDQVSGTFDASRTSWRSSTVLNVAQTYAVTATGVDAAGLTVTTTSTFTTLTPAHTFRTHIFEGENDSYGVGMPIELTFSQSVTDRAAVENALHVTTSQPVVGAWMWLDDKHVDFRPRDYWPAHTTVTFTGLLNGVQAAPGVYGAADLTQSFQIGDSLIVTASTTSHHMQLYRNGQLQADWPISTGKRGHDTPNGTYLTIDKANPQEMKPSDIAPGQPGYYDVQVPWSVRFTWSGDFLHAASWSVASQGSSDVSHGCVNMPPAAAQAYYQEELPGDPVTITDSPLAGTPGDGWTDWFESWQQVLDKSATHEAVEAGPGGSVFVAPSDVPATTASAPLTTSPGSNAAAA